jgi:hypothetical protein
MNPKTSLVVGILCCVLTHARALQSTNAVDLAKFHPVVAPKPSGLALKVGDKLAICGDSITEQKMYSRIMEDYLTMCVPDLGVTVRQFGWSGEKAPGFLARMTNDCLRFKPTIATTCYGMNDHEYRAYEDRIGEAYRSNSVAIVEAFKANGVRVIQGSPGCVGKVPRWRPGPSATVEDLNLNLCNLRNIGIEIAQQEKVGFADVFWPMLTAGETAHERYGQNYAIAGNDGVHPAWAGHLVMAYAFLTAFGLDGDIGTVNVDLGSGKTSASPGHEVVSSKGGEIQLKSTRYPFCACVEEKQLTAPYPVCGTDDVMKDNTIVSGMSLVPFDEKLNRFTLVAIGGKGTKYRITWGKESKTFTAEQLAHGVNLADAFPCNPFCEAFSKVDAAVIAKQTFETAQIKKRFHSTEGKANPDAVAAETEKEHEPLSAAIKTAFVPVTHTIKIEAE